MARTFRKSGMKEVPLSEIKDDLSRFLREAETQEIVITRHGKPAGVLIGFESEEDWFEYRLEHDPRFLRRIEQARASLRAGRGIALEDLDSQPGLGAHRVHHGQHAGQHTNSAQRTWSVHQHSLPKTSDESMMTNLLRPA